MYTLLFNKYNNLLQPKYRLQKLKVRSSSQTNIFMPNKIQYISLANSTPFFLLTSMLACTLVKFIHS